MRTHTILSAHRFMKIPVFPCSACSLSGAAVTTVTHYEIQKLCKSDFRGDFLSLLAAVQEHTVKEKHEI